MPEPDSFGNSPVNRSKDSDQPFCWSPPGPARAAVVLVHGFTASPWEMRPFGEALLKEGYRVHGILLPGHGTTPEDLAARRWEEWRQAVAQAYRGAAACGLPIYGIGMSTGGLLLLAAASECSWQGLVLLSPYLRLRHRLAPLVGLLRFFKRFQSRSISPERADHYYERRPLAGIYQLLRLTRRVRRLAPTLRVPCLVLSASEDRTVHAESALELFHLLGSARKEFHLFGPGVPHILATAENPRWRTTFTLSRDFLQDLEETRR